MTRKSGDKWSKFKEIGTKKNQIGESGGERKKNPSANPEMQVVWLWYWWKDSEMDRFFSLFQAAASCS